MTARASSIRPAAIERHLSRAADHRERAESLVHTMEVLSAKLAAMDNVPLDVIDRFERCVVAAHTANLLRLPAYSGLLEDES